MNRSAMPDYKPDPGVSRKERITEEGLQRLEKQLRNGSKMQPQVLEQWIRCYGNAARDLINRYSK